MAKEWPACQLLLKRLIIRPLKSQLVAEPSIKMPWTNAQLWVESLEDSLPELTLTLIPQVRHLKAIQTWSMETELPFIRRVLMVDLNFPTNNSMWQCQAKAWDQDKQRLHMVEEWIQQTKIKMSKKCNKLTPKAITTLCRTNGPEWCMVNHQKA